MQRTLRSYRYLSRLLSTASPPKTGFEITENCARRLRELTATKGHQVALRVTVDSGGCSGFQYLFELEKVPPPEKRDTEEDTYVTLPDGTCVVCDNLSLGYISGSKVDYVSELIGSSFRVVDNPNSESSCGCGVSFAAKG